MIVTSQNVEKVPDKPIFLQVNVKEMHVENKIIQDLMDFNPLFILQIRKIPAASHRWHKKEWKV